MPCDIKDLSILVVDDEPWMRALLRDILRTFGVREIQMAANAPTAYRTLRNYGPDVVLLDWELKPVHGRDFLQRIRNDEKSPNPYVHVIVLTNSTDLDQVIECRDAGATSVVSKPIVPRTLHRRIVWAVEGRQFLYPSVYFGPEPSREAAETTLSD